MRKIKTELCIMPPNPRYATVRSGNLHRHEIFYGTGLRQKSIQYGLVVFLTPEMHNQSNQGVHFDRDFDVWLKQQGQKAAMAHYGWTIDDFRREFYKNYLEVGLNDKTQ